MSLNPYILVVVFGHIPQIPLLHIPVGAWIVHKLQYINTQRNTKLKTQLFFSLQVPIDFSGTSKQLPGLVAASAHAPGAWRMRRPSPRSWLWEISRLGSGGDKRWRLKILHDPKYLLAGEFWYGRICRQTTGGDPLRFGLPNICNSSAGTPE